MGIAIECCIDCPKIIQESRIPSFRHHGMMLLLLLLPTHQIYTSTNSHQKRPVLPAEPCWSEERDETVPAGGQASIRYC